MIATRQISTIHALAARAALEDADYRALLSRYGVASSTQLLGTQAEALIAELRILAGPERPAPSAGRATGRYAPVLQSLWIAGYNLGIVRDKTDRAMMAFVQRQTDIPHTRFLVDHKDATAAIEALKAWLRREAGIVWPKTVIFADRQRAVCETIVKRLDALGGWSPPAEAPIWPYHAQRYGLSLGLPVTLELYTEDDWMALANGLGKRLRAAQAKAARAADKAATAKAKRQGEA